MSHSETIKSGPAALFNRHYPAALVVAVSIGVYANTLLNGFVFDDIPNVLENRWITDARFIPEIFSTHIAGFSSEYSTSYFRPLIHVIYMACHGMFGYSPWGFHLVNVLIHAAASLVAYAISVRLFFGTEESGGRLPPALLAALLFAVHPVHTEAVAWVSGIMDTSFSLFYLLSFYMYMRAGEGNGTVFDSRYLASLCAFFLAALCKEPALTLPLLLAAYDFGRRGRGVVSIEYLKRYLPFLALAAVYLALRVHAIRGFAPAQGMTDLGGFQYVLNAFPLFADYLWKLILPIDLSPVHAFHPVRSIMEAKSVVSILVTIAFIAACYLARNESRLFLGLSMIAIPLLPAFYISAISGEGVFAERYLYLPTFGYAVVLALLYSRAVILMGRYSAYASLIAAALIVVFSVGTITRNADWKDGHALWSDAVKKSPGSAAAHQYLGYALYSRGDVQGAIAEYGKALSLNPKLFDARFNLGIAYHSIGMIGMAIEQYRIALVHHPRSADVHNALGMAYGRAGSLNRAIEHFRTALELDPGNEEARKNLHSARALGNRNSGKPPSTHP